MYYILWPFRLIFKVYFFIVFCLSLILLYPVLYYLLSDSHRFPKAFIVMRYHAFALLLFAGVYMKIEGKENIPKEGAFIICPNHSSFLDIFCLYTLFSQYFVFVGKKEIEKWPIFHLYYTSGMNILVDRNNKLGDIKALKRMTSELKNGNPLVIFPEGTISFQAPKMVPFKAGAFSIAIKNQVPILPVTFSSNWRRLQRKSIWTSLAGPGISKVTIHNLFVTEGLTKENVLSLQDQVYSIINQPLCSQ